MKKNPTNYTVDVPLKSGGFVSVQAFEDSDGNVVASSAHRQPIKGPKVHGGHCALCGAEVDPMTRESFRGVCSECVKKDTTGRWDE